jgi:hypothetical protein
MVHRARAYTRFERRGAQRLYASESTVTQGGLSVCVCVCYAPNLGAVPSQRAFSHLNVRVAESRTGRRATWAAHGDYLLSPLIGTYLVPDGTAGRA